MINQVLHVFTVPHPWLGSVATVAGFSGAALAAGMVVPQILRTYRNRQLPGVSWTSWALISVCCLAWLLYGVRASEAPQIPGNVITVSGAALIALAVPAPIGRGARLLGLAGAAAAAVAMALVLTPEELGFVAFAIGLTSTVPQAVQSVIGSDQAESGVSIATWAMFGSAESLWLTYGIIVHSVPVMVGSAMVISTSILVSVCELHRRQRRTAGARQALRFNLGGIAQPTH